MTTGMPPSHHVLFIDAYDSFSNNIIALLEAECGVKVTRIFIDAAIAEFQHFLIPFSAVVCGPGPGHPARSSDVGLFEQVWKLSQERLVPVLGICLGFQSLAHEYGAAIVRLPQPRHGIRTLVTTTSTSIFAGLPSINAVQYHSLHALIGQNVRQPDGVNHLWTPFNQSPELQPLAWDLSSQNEGTTSLYINPLPILMAVKHVEKPFYGIQFHPESVCSDQSAKQIVVNWWREAQTWSQISRHSNMGNPDRISAVDLGGPQTCHYSSSRTSIESSRSTTSAESSPASSISQPNVRRQKLLSVSLPLQRMTVPQICEALDLPAGEVIVLDSEKRVLRHIGEVSIIGVILPDTTKIKYSVGETKVYINSREKTEIAHLSDHSGSIFSFLKAFIAGFALEANDDRVFSGGLMGYVSYEACLETIAVDAPEDKGRPGLEFAFVKQSLLVDHRLRLLHIQELVDDDSECSSTDWFDKTCSVLQSLSKGNGPSLLSLNTPVASSVAHMTLPEKSKYNNRVKQCKELISAGESYELCLTDQTIVTLQDGVPAWSMYKHLRHINSANFGAFVRLGPVTILSTSPERFLQWSRFRRLKTTQSDKTDCGEQHAICQFRPMKGTVRKYQKMHDGSVRHISYEEASAILAAPKEQAENLMILDLIRHDLHGVCQNVSVPGLMVVEDYESVYQLVSVVEGTISKPSCLGPYEGPSGIDCLAVSLPPGSMTGAPKKRSCQLLSNIEGKPRSVYSGVLGYIDVRGNGDFSVLIRCMYKWDDEIGSDGAKWNIGAGGAITTLSTEEGEWEEMLTKLQSTLRVFGPEQT